MVVVVENATKPSRFAGAQSLAPATRNDIWTSKSGPRIVCFVHFGLEMCFAPQPRALFRHRNFQKWSDAGVFYTFWPRNVLRATTACNFSSLIWPAGSAPAALASLLFDPLEPQIIGKTQCFTTFLPFRAPASSFFAVFLFSDLLSSALLFSILLLHLCFSSVHIVGSLTSKLPSTMYEAFRRMNVLFGICTVVVLRYHCHCVQKEITCETMWNLKNDIMGNQKKTYWFVL